MGAIDPTYPLYPTACILAATGLFIVLLSNYYRQNWNLSVALLCFWLFVGCLIDGINAIVWSDNRELKFYVYCDIASHIRLIIYVVRPMSTFLIMRRLYNIANLQSVKPTSKAIYVRDLAVEWTLGLLVPAIVAGPLYYVNQLARFQVLEGFGCVDSYGDTIVGILTLDSWTIIPPLVSITFFYPKVIRTFCRHRREGNRFSRSVGSVPREQFLRIFALASIDILIILPMGITNLVISIVLALEVGGDLPWYYGWADTHAGTGQAASIPYSDLQAVGTPQVASTYFEQWSSPILAFAVFGLFGLTRETRASYWGVIYTVGGWCGWKPMSQAGNRRSQMTTMGFNGPPEEVTAELPQDAEIGVVTSFMGGDTTSSSCGETEGEGSEKQDYVCDAESEKRTTTDEIGLRLARQGTSAASSFSVSGTTVGSESPDATKREYDASSTST